MNRSGAGDAPVIVAARRTPIGTAGHALRGLTAAELVAPLITDAAGELAGTAPIRDVFLGNCTGPGGNLARFAALQAGLPVDVPGLTVDRQCGSGLAAIVLAAATVREEPGIVLAGGVESASTAPWRFWPPTDGDPVRYERAPFAPAALGDPEMGPAADALAHRYGIARDAQDEYAARSHARAVASQAAGLFDAEIVPVGALRVDERPRAGLTTHRLARLHPVYAADGTVTAGNACGINDGAALVALVDGATFARTRRPGLRILATATAGVHPELPGIGIVPAARRALERAGLDLGDIDVIEFNEAFAGQVLACCAELGLDPRRVCRDGGALALGHPWGASGAVLAVRLFSQLVRRPGGRYGLAAIAVGGGQGVAMVVEAAR